MLSPEIHLDEEGEFTDDSPYVFIKDILRIANSSPSGRVRQMNVPTPDDIPDVVTSWHAVGRAIEALRKTLHGGTMSSVFSIGKLHFKYSNHLAVFFFFFTLYFLIYLFHLLYILYCC